MIVDYRRLHLFENLIEIIARRSLERIRFTERLHSNAMQTRLITVGRRVRLELIYNRDPGIPVVQHLLHLQVLHIKLLRCFHSFVAPAVELHLVDGGAGFARRVNEMLEIPVRSGAIHGGVEFPAEWLDGPPSVAPRPTSNPPHTAHREVPLPRIFTAPSARAGMIPQRYRLTERAAAATAG